MARYTGPVCKLCRREGEKQEKNFSSRVVAACQLNALLSAKVMFQGSTDKVEEGGRQIMEPSFVKSRRSVVSMVFWKTSFATILKMLT